LFANDDSVDEVDANVDNVMVIASTDGSPRSRSSTTPIGDEIPIPETIYLPFFFVSIG